MTQITISDFSIGMDVRKSSLTAAPGTLRLLRNCHITPGGEIEKRFAFVKIDECDPVSRGLVECNQKLYAFMPGGPGQVDPADDFSVGQLLLDTDAINDVIDYDLFDNKVFVVIDVDGAGTVLRFFDGAQVPDATGRYVRTYKTKVFGVDGSVLSFSAVGDAADWTGTGSGVIDLSLEDSDMTDCVSLEVYYDKLAIFSSTSVQLWSIDPDPLQTQYDQTLRQAGTIAWRSVLQYGSGDVIYVGPSGIRSLRARDASLAAAVSDVGSPLDPLMQEILATLGADFASKAIALLQPVTGRFWIILPDRIYILSDFPGPKVQAWSQYDPTDADGNEFSIVAATTMKQRVYVRDSNHNVYVFGGGAPTGPTFDACPVELIFPFHGGNEPGVFKNFHGLDAACTGKWDVYASFDPTTEAEDYLGQFDGPTFLEGRFPMAGHTTHMSLRLRSAVEGPLTLSSMIIHFELADSA